MRISDWSSDVCSSDLRRIRRSQHWDYCLAFRIEYNFRSGNQTRFLVKSRDKLRFHKGSFVVQSAGRPIRIARLKAISGDGWHGNRASTNLSVGHSAALQVHAHATEFRSEDHTYEIQSQ